MLLVSVVHFYCNYDRLALPHGKACIPMYIIDFMLHYHKGIYLFILFSMYHTYEDNYGQTIKKINNEHKT